MDEIDWKEKLKTLEENAPFVSYGIGVTMIVSACACVCFQTVFICVLSICLPVIGPLLSVCCCLPFFGLVMFGFAMGPLFISGLYGKVFEGKDEELVWRYINYLNHQILSFCYFPCMQCLYMCNCCLCPFFCVLQYIYAVFSVYIMAKPPPAIGAKMDRIERPVEGKNP